MSQLLVLMSFTLIHPYPPITPAAQASASTSAGRPSPSISSARAKSPRPASLSRSFSARAVNYLGGHVADGWGALILFQRIALEVFVPQLFERGKQAAACHRS